MAKKNIKITFKAQNIGPHINLSNELNFNSLKIGVFGNNGCGKTFLSRMFRLIENPEIENVNKVLTIKTNTGSFGFQIDEKRDDGDTSEKLEIKVSKDKDPIISNGTKYIYHVFNSDYVKENVDDKNYTTFYNFGNNARKFLELFLYYKYPDSSSQVTKMKKFFGSDDIPVVLTDRINNEYSHLRGAFERGETLVEIPEMSTAARLIIERIKEDNDQYVALLNSIGVEVPEAIEESTY